MPSIPNSPESRERAWETLKSAFNDVSDTRPIQGFKKIAGVCGAVIARVGIGALNFFGLELLRNPNLSTRQKIFPAIGVTLAAITLVPSIIVSLVGISVLIPPFSIAASVTGVIRNVGMYIKERTERNNLRKVLVSEEQLKKQINKTLLEDSQKTTLIDYATKQKDLYNALYAVRKVVIESSEERLSLAEKHNLLSQINDCITSVSTGETKPLLISFTESVDKTLILNQLSVYVAEANKRILNYRDITEKVKNMDVPPSLQTSIESYRDMRGKIYSQDLPEKIKDSVVQLMETKKNSRKSIKEIFARIGNHYLNITPQAQKANLERNIVTSVTDFPAPRVEFKYRNNDPLAKTKTALDDSNVAKVVQGGVRNAKNGVIRQLFGSHGLIRRQENRALKSQRRAMEADFKDRYQATYDALLKRERLGYLEKSTKKRLVDIGLGVLNAAISITATAMMASIATPAAPVAIAGVALSVTGTVLTVASLGMAIDLGIKEANAQKKVDSPAFEATKGIAPHVKSSLTSETVSRPEPVTPEWKQAASNKPAPTADSPKPALGNHRKGPQL